ncbi:MAG: hypothetical protein U0271_44645 [Polyangiaceae bacterium]
MPKRWTSVALLSCVVGLGGCEGPGNFGGGGVGGGYEVGGGGPDPARPQADEAGGAGGGTAAGTGGQGDPAAVCGLSTFDFAPVQSHRLASPTFALAAVLSNAWPDNVEVDGLKREEFLTFFAAPTSGDLLGSAGYGRLRTDDQGKLVMDAFVAEPPATFGDPVPVHLVVVVDTSSSMRNDLSFAANVVEKLATGLGSKDAISFVEWGGTATLFQSGKTSVFEAGPNATDAAATFEQHLIELANGQLGPGGSLTTASQVVEDAMVSNPDGQQVPDPQHAQHVVLLTDGGMVPDAATLGAIGRWRRQGALVSFAEIQGALNPDESPMALGSFHADLLEQLSVQAGGLTLVLTPANVSVLDSFDMLFRPASRAARFAMSSTDVVEFEAPAFGLATTGDRTGATSEPQGTWLPLGRPAFFSGAVSLCHSDAAQATVTIEATGDHPLPDKVSVTGAFADPDQDPRLTRLGIVDLVYDQFVAGCPADLTMFDTLAGLVNQLPDTDAGYQSLRQLVGAMKTACGGG